MAENETSLPRIASVGTGGDGVVYCHPVDTDSANARGVFGLPTYFMDGDMFCSQDHLMMETRALRAPFAGEERNG